MSLDDDMTASYNACHQLKKYVALYWTHVVLGEYPSTTAYYMELHKVESDSFQQAELNKRTSRQARLFTPRIRR